MEDVMERMDRGERVEPSYLDLQKAIDSVKHPIWIKQLKAYETDEHAVKWIEDILIATVLRVVIHQTKSGVAYTLKGYKNAR